MEIKFSKKKEELRHDPVLEAIGKSQAYIVKYRNTLMSSAVIVVLVIGGIFAFSYIQKSGQRRANEAFGKAMIAVSKATAPEAIEALSQVSEQYRSSPQAAYAALMIGSLFLREDKIDDAITWFTTAAQHKKAGFVSGEAFEALAACSEIQGNGDEALAYLKKALANKNASYRYAAIRWKLALLTKKMGRTDEARQYCEQILSDSLALPYKQKAENLLTEITIL